jgi:hypothetical protein
MEQFGAAVAEIAGEYTEVAFEILGAMEAVHPTDPQFYLFVAPGLRSGLAGSAVR